LPGLRLRALLLPLGALLGLLGGALLGLDRGGPQPRLQLLALPRFLVRSPFDLLLVALLRFPR
jgi:hypothetical protein